MMKRPITAVPTIMGSGGRAPSGVVGAEPLRRKAVEQILPALLLLSLPLLLCLPAQATDLVQLLEPASTTVTLYPGQTRALVRETWPLQLPAGETTVNFSWTAAGLDASSATLVVDGATVGDAVRASGQDKAMAWRVKAAQPLPAQAAVTYFLDGFKWYPTYRLWLQPEAKSARLVGSVHLTNATGVDLGQAQVQVALAGPGMIDRVGGDGANPTPGAVATLPAVGQSVCLPDGSTQDREMLRVEQIPAELGYVYQAERFNGAVERTLALRLPEGLGGLSDGAMTIYEPQDDTLPLFVTQLSYQPGQELKVDLGPEPDIVLERKLMNTARSNFETDRFGRFTGSDTTEDYELSVRNRLAAPITLAFTETVLSTWDLKCGLAPDKSDTSWAQFNLTVSPNQPLDLKYTLVKHSGTRAKRK